MKLFGGKAAPSYARAKLIIKLINDVGRVLNADPETSDRLQVVYLPDYKVSLAERMVPAGDLSEQISTAGMEASGTGNMKFAMNGSLTIGTLDGANVEMRDAVGADEMVIFGLTAEEVAQLRRTGHDPRAMMAASPALTAAIEAIASGVFSPDDPARFRSLVDDLTGYDHFLVTADFDAYRTAQAEVDRRWLDSAGWQRSSLANIAGMGRFSSDRSIREYADHIWNIPQHG